MRGCSQVRVVGSAVMGLAILRDQSKPASQEDPDRNHIDTDSIRTHPKRSAIGPERYRTHYNLAMIRPERARFTSIYPDIPQTTTIRPYPLRLDPNGATRVRWVHFCPVWPFIRRVSAHLLKSPTAEVRLVVRP
jgi:hypothetical protein